MKKKILICLIVIALLTASFFAGGYVKEQKHIENRLQRCCTLISFAIDKAENESLSDQSTESATDFIGYHDITGMFSDLEHPGLVEVDERGTWGKMAQDLSKRVMALPPELRDGCCDTIMGLLERGEGSTIGIHGERPDILDVLELGAYGVPIILFTALEHGPEIIKDLTKDWSSKDWAAFLTTAIATAYLLPVIAPVIGLVAEAAGIVYLGVLVFTSAVELIMAALDLCKNLYE